MAVAAHPIVENTVATHPVDRGGRARWYRRCGSKRRGFYYQDAQGRRITDPDEIARIRALVIPPAWTEVRICPSPGGRLQAVGVDACGRVQYRYHPTFAARQQRKKFDKLLRFGEALPMLRQATNEHLGGSGLGRDRVLAVVVRLINDLYFRVGSEKSVVRYRTYGITTLRNRHLTIRRGGALVFSYVGKHHIRQRRVVVDADLAAVMRELKTIGGSKLFNYVDDEGNVHPITSRDVNEYVKRIMGPAYSAKDFRTWGGTLLAAIALAELGPAPNGTQAKKNAVRAVQRVAERLGNTPTVCRKCYVHPGVFECYAKGVTLKQFRPRAARYIRRHQPDYEPEEVALLELLREVVEGARAQPDRRAA